MRFNYQLDGNPHQLRAFRQALEVWPHVIPALGDDLLIVANELTSNALTYGLPPIQVTVVASRAQIRIQVTQNFSGSNQVPELAKEPGLRGRGLVLVNALSSEWGWLQSGPSLVVWAVLALPGNLSQ